MVISGMFTGSLLVKIQCSSQVNDFLLTQPTARGPSFTDAGNMPSPIIAEIED
jgi:hypothetical protein